MKNNKNKKIDLKKKHFNMAFLKGKIKSKISINLKHYIINPNGLVKKISNKVFRLKYSTFTFWVVLYYAIGTVFQRLDQFTDFYVFQLIFVSIFYITYVTIKSGKKDIEKLEYAIAPDVAHIIDVWNRLNTSLFNVIIPVFVGCYFGLLAMFLVDIPLFSLTTLYMEISYVLCVLISLYGYLQYIYLKVISNRIYKHSEEFDYDEEYPAHTEWLIILVKITNKYRNVFFILGSIYLFTVYRFITFKSFGVINKLNNLYINKILLLAFVISVIIAIAFVFPILSIIEHYWITSTVENLKKRSVKTISDTIDFNKRIPQISQLKISIIETPSYPIKGTVSKLIAGTSTVLNIAVSILNINDVIQKLI